MTSTAVYIMYGMALPQFVHLPVWVWFLVALLIGGFADYNTGWEWWDNRNPKVSAR